MAKAGNANRGGVVGVFWNTPLKILGKIFEKTGEKLRNLG